MSREQEHDAQMSIADNQNAPQSCHGRGTIATREIRRPKSNLKRYFSHRLHLITPAAAAYVIFELNNIATFKLVKI